MSSLSSPYLHSVPVALFSKLVDDNTEKAIVKALKNNPSSTVHLGKPELPRVYEDNTLEVL